MHAVVRELAAICGPEHVRLAGPADTVAGVPARVVVAPGSVTDLVATVRAALARELTVVARGSGSKMDWGRPPHQVDLVLDTHRLAGVWHHAPRNRSAEIGIGTPIRLVQDQLAASGQRLALDPPSDATVGGVLAADESGPLRHRFGGPADQLAGVSFVSADGVLRHAERGQLPAAGCAELAGTDIPRLLCGSHGGLGVLVAATFRLTPVPPARQWVRRSVWTPAEVHGLVRALDAAGVAPAALELDLPAPLPVLLPRQRGRSGPGSLAVLIEGRVRPADVQAATARRVLGGDAIISSRPPLWWGRYPFAAGDVALRLAAPPQHLQAAVYALRDAAGSGVPVRGSAGVALVHAALPGGTAPDRVAATLAAVRGVLLARGGSCRVLAAPPGIRDAVGLWGEPADTARLREIKHHCDPAGLLAPGRYP